MAGESVSETLRSLRERAGLSRDELGREMGSPNGKFLQRYEDPTRYREALLPLELVAKLSHALVGKGNPPITSDEIWLLAELRSGLTVVPTAVTLVPIVRWEMLKQGSAAIKLANPDGATSVAGLPSGDYLALEVNDARCAVIVPAGGQIIVDINQTELREGWSYIIIVDGEPEARLYRSNPARFESYAIPLAATLYPTGPIQVIGRIVRAITHL